MLTDRQIKHLKPEKKAYRIYDKTTDDYRGFHIQVTPAGAKIFAVAFTLHNKKRFFTIGRYPTFTLSNARDECKRVRQLIQRGIDPKEEKLRTIASEETTRIRREKKLAADKLTATFSDLAELYYEHLENPNTKQLCSGMFKHDVLPSLQNRRLSEISTEDIKKVLHRPHKRGSKSTQRSLYQFLHAAFELAITANSDSSIDSTIIWPEINNPVSSIKKPPKSIPRQRYLAADEIVSAWNAGQDSNVSEQAKRILLILLSTGQRVQEVTGMRWSELDFKDSIWTIPPERIKTGKVRPQPHVVPMTRLVRTILRQTPRLNDTYVFPHAHKDQPMPWRSVGQAVRRLTENTEIERFQTKDLRRTVKTHMARLQIAKPIRDMVQNHSLNDVSSIYYDQWDGLPEKRAALNKWNRELLSILSRRDYQ